MTSGMTENYIFKSGISKMLEHNEVLLVLSWSLNVWLSNAFVTSIMRQGKPEELKASEQPLKFTLMLLGIPVENSKQYGSKWHELLFRKARKSPESVLLGRATHHSIRNVSKFRTHTQMSSYEAKIFFNWKDRDSPSQWHFLDRASLMPKFQFLLKI